MSEQERQQKIAAALKATGQRLRSVIDAIQSLQADLPELDRRLLQIENLGRQFEAGRYLPRETDAAVETRDGEAPDPQPV
jgi:hypothetical protein